MTKVFICNFVFQFLFIPSVTILKFVSFVWLLLSVFLSFFSFSNSFCLSFTSSSSSIFQSRNKCKQMVLLGFLPFFPFLRAFLFFFFPPFRQGTSKIICLLGAKAYTAHLLRYVAWNEHNWKKESLHVFFVGCQACPDLNRFDLGREILYTYVFFTTTVPLRPLVTPPLVKPGSHDRYRCKW